MPFSDTVGTSGNTGERARLVTAKARTWPSFTRLTAGGIELK
jgi:hypothetical protein